MEIRANKLVRELGMNYPGGLETFGRVIGIDEISPNTKLSIIEVNSQSDVVNMDRLDGLDMLDLISLRNKIESAIEKREAIIQLEGALQRLAFVGIKEIAMNGYFVSHMEDAIVPSMLNEIV